MIAKPISIKDAGGKSGGSRIESSRTYRGRSAACCDDVTDGEEIHPDGVAEVSSGRKVC